MPFLASAYSKQKTLLKLIRDFDLKKSKSEHDQHNEDLQVM